MTQTGTQLTEQNNAAACGEQEPVDKQEGDQKADKCNAKLVMPSEEQFWRDKHFLEKIMNISGWN